MFPLILTVLDSSNPPPIIIPLEDCEYKGELGPFTGMDLPQKLLKH